VLSYKDLNLSSDEFGGNDFVENLPDTAKFTLELEQ